MDTPNKRHRSASKENTPVKNAQHLSSPLLNSPLKHKHKHNQESTNTETNTKRVLSENNDRDNTPSNENAVVEVVEYTEIEAEQNRSQQNVSIVNDDITNNTDHVLSPIKINQSSKSGDSFDGDNNKSLLEDSDTVKQFSNRLAQILATPKDEEEGEVEGEVEAEGEGEGEGDQSVLFLQLQNIKNEYNQSVIKLSDEINNHRVTINQLNNQINDYNHKISNLHLTIEESNSKIDTLNLDNSQLNNEISLLKESLNSLNAKLQKQASLKNSKNEQIENLQNLANQILTFTANQSKNIIHLKEENSKILKANLNNEQKILKFDQTLKNEQEILAQELYIQYAEKHENKINKLRKAYELKFNKKQSLINDKLQLLAKENENLKQELSNTKQRLQVETSEKQHLVKLWDEYMALDKKDIDKMASFVNRLK